MYADRYRIAHTDRFGVTHQIFIEEDGFSGTVSELDASGDFFSVEYVIDDERNFWAGQIIDVRITAQVEVTTAGVKTFFEGIVNQPLGKYRVRYQKNATVEVKATLQNDIVDIADSNFPFTVKFEASAFAQEKATQTFLVNDASIMATIAALTEFDLPLQSINNLRLTGQDDDDDFFDIATMNGARLQQFSDGQAPVQRLTRFESLRECLPHGFFLLQRAGTYYVYQISQIVQNDGEGLRAFAYNSSGVQTAFLPSFNLSQAADYDITPQSFKRNNGGIKRIKYDYNHGTLDKVIPLPPLFSQSIANPERVFSINVRDTVGGILFINGQIRNFLDNEDAGVSQVELTIRAGERYWGNAGWNSNSTTRLSIPLFSVSGNPNIIGGDDVHAASVAIQTDPVPVHFNAEDVEITFRLGSTNIAGSEVQATQYIGFDGVLANEEIGDAVVYQVEQAADLPLDIELPPKLFGQGPNVYSPGAYGNGGSEPVYLVGEAVDDARDLGVLVLEEIIATQRNGILSYKPNAVTNLSFGRGINIGGRFAILLGGTYRARDGVITDAFLLAGKRSKTVLDTEISTKGKLSQATAPGVTSTQVSNAFTDDGKIRKSVQVEVGGVNGTLSSKTKNLNDTGKFVGGSEIIVDDAFPAVNLGNYLQVGAGDTPVITSGVKVAVGGVNGTLSKRIEALQNDGAIEADALIASNSEKLFGVGGVGVGFEPQGYQSLVEVGDFTISIQKSLVLIRTTGTAKLQGFTTTAQTGQSVALFFKDASESNPVTIEHASTVIPDPILMPDNADLVINKPNTVCTFRYADDAFTYQNVWLLESTNIAGASDIDTDGAVDGDLLVRENGIFKPAGAIDIRSALGLEEGFVMTINSANAGVTTDTEFQLTGAVGDYDVEVYQNNQRISKVFNLSGQQTITLPSAGVYDILVIPKGATPFDRIQFNNGGDKDKVIALRSFGVVEWSSFAFAFRGGNIATLPASVNRLNGVNVTTFRECFEDNNLTAIPAGLFDNCPNVTSFSRCFRLNNLATIPAGLFDNCPNVTNFLLCFFGNNLTTIPAGLFDNNPNVTTFQLCFFDNNLTSIPAGLFDNCPNVTTFRDCFRGNSLTTLPAGLFDNCPNVTSFTLCFLDNNLTSIPAGLFDNNPNVTTFIQCFRNNSITTLPAGLFDNCPNVTTFSFCFLGNTLEVESLSRLYIELESTNVEDNVPFHGGSGKFDPNFTLGGLTTEQARDNLIARGWTLSDGGSI